MGKEETSRRTPPPRTSKPAVTTHVTVVTTVVFAEESRKEYPRITRLCGQSESGAQLTRKWRSWSATTHAKTRVPPGMIPRSP